MKNSLYCMLMVSILLLIVSATGFAGSIYPLEPEDGLQGFDLLCKGSQREVELGTSMITGDFNGDGKMDLAVGAPRTSSPRGKVEAGMVSVFFGGEDFNSLPQKFEAVEGGQESATLYGSAEYEYAGEFLAAGDINGDGVDDLVIAAQKVNDTGAPYAPDKAKIYVVYGGPSFVGSISLSTGSDVVISRTDAMHAEYIAVGDVNNDGVGDILISDILTNDVSYPPFASRSGTGEKGALYIIYGGSLPSTIDPSVDSDAVIERLNEDDIPEEDLNDDSVVIEDIVEDGIFQIYGISTGDFNGDGKNDIALGAQGEGNRVESLSSAGNVYILLGGEPLSGTVYIDRIKDVIISGGYEKDKAGGTLASGDINADGIDDLVIGAPLSGWGEPGTTGKGKVDVVFGSTSLKSSLDLYSDSDVNLQLSDDAARIGFKTGKALAVKDINGDGIDDLAISSPNAFVTDGANGWVHGIYGASVLKDEYKLDLDSDFAVIAPEITSADPLAGGRMGTTLAMADFNHDGNCDLVLGASWGEGNNGYTGSGWFGVIFNLGKSSLDNCLMLNEDFSFMVPNLILGDTSFGIKFLYGGGLDLTLDLSSMTDPDEDFVTIGFNADYSLSIPCIDILGSMYQFTLIPDSTLMNWQIDLDSFLPFEE